MTYSVSFHASFWVRNFSFGYGTDEGFDFDSDNPSIDISVRPATQADMELRGIGAWCEVKRTLPADEPSAQFIAALCKGIYLAGPDTPIVTPYDHGGQRLIEEDGRVRDDFFVQRQMLPPQVIELFDQAYSMLANDQSRFVRLVRWRKSLGGAPQPYEGAATVRWKALDAPYAIAPYQPFPLFWRNPIEIGWDEESAAAFRETWAAHDDEPTGHEMLREAENLLATAHRSAFLVGYAALEIGIKNHLTAMLPRTSALITHIPSPPLEKLFKAVLPEVHPELAKIDWKKMPLLKPLHVLTESRNALAHRGTEIDREKVADYLDVIHDLLYVLDALRGHAWARKLLYSQDAMDFMRWSGLALARVQIRIKDFS